MNALNHLIITSANEQQREEIVALLVSEGLPVADLPPSLHNFFVALEGDKVIGAIGLEQHKDCGLLRSMVVSKEHRNKSIAAHLVNRLERHAVSLNITCIYLLTETATQYFERKGYEKIVREDVPDAVKASSEFSHVCPVSAIVMKKMLHQLLLKNL